MKPHLVFLALAACSAQPPHLSPDVSTRDIAIAVGMDSPGHLAVTASGPGGDVVMLAPERLVVAKGGMEWPLVHVATGYVTDIGNTNGPMELHLERSGDENAVEPFLVPPPFTVKAPAAMSRAVGITFTWDGQVASSETSFALAGPCIKPLGRTLGMDTGSYTINPAELEGGGMITGSCDVVLTVTRTVTSSGPTSSLKGFSSKFTASSSTTFTSTP